MGLRDFLQRLNAALILAVASGFAALGYQIVWTQQAGIWLGHEAAAVLAVVAAFFGGLALGSLALGPRIDASPRPARWYAACEALIGLWSIALAFLMAPAGKALLDLTGAQPTAAWQWAVAFLGTFVLLLPATAAMGATLPAMERLASSIPALYAANTFGAVAGVLAAAFWLIPEFGLVRTAAVCAAMNMVCAVLAFGLFKEFSVQTTNQKNNATSLVLTLTGFLGIGYEVVVVRVLSQVLENTVYTFAMLLAVYLVGTALGAAAYQRWLYRYRESLFWMVALACLVGGASLWGAEKLVLRGMAAEAFPAVAAFFLPAFMMGALFSHLCTAPGVSFGRALGVNTLGAAAAPLVFGVLLLPAIGAKGAVLLIVAGYVVLSFGLTKKFFMAAVPMIALATGMPPLAFVEVPDGGHVVSYKEGVTAAVSVVEDAEGVRRLRIDNREQEGSSATRYSDSRQALLPLLLHPAPRRALFLGLGTGVTASAAAAQMEVDAVELVPEVIEASALFRQGEPSPHLIASDARRFVRATANRYDLIVSDNFHPARSGSAALYTVEHFRAVRERLAPGGLFCQWLPLHQLDLGTLRSIVRAFLEAYPGGWAMLATNSLDTPVVGLVFSAKLFKGDSLELVGNFIAGPASLKRFSAAAPLNTDDHPVVAYRAPRVTYSPDSLPRDRLLALLREVEITPEEVVVADVAWRARLAAYWAARNRFLEAGRDVQPTPDVRRMLAQVREPLLAVLRISPDFRPAYDPLARMAAALERIDAEDARALRAELRQVSGKNGEDPPH